MAFNEALVWNVLSLCLQSQSLSLCCVITISQARICIREHLIQIYTPYTCLVTCRNPNPKGDLTNRPKIYLESKVRALMLILRSNCLGSSL